MSANTIFNSAQITALAGQFDAVCMKAVQTGATLGYDAKIYLKMRSQYGAINTAIRLIDGTVHYGVDRLWQLNRLDLTLEAIIYNNPSFQALFPANTLSNCIVLLKSLGYIP